MSGPPSDILDAVVWLILPDSAHKNEEATKKWLQGDNVTNWLKALQEGSRTTLQIRCIVIFPYNPAVEEVVRSNVRTALRAVFDITDVSFENDSCLRGTKSQLGESSCDLVKDSRDHQVYRLLLVDEQGNGFPCYGAWEAFRNGESDFPNQGTLKWAYRNGNFRSLCRECVNGHPESNWEIFPCSRCGCQVWSTVWGGAREYHHLQFTGRDGRWCPSFKPDFEISLEQSRSRLERLLFEDEFWRHAFIEARRPLDHFWPDDPSSDGNIIPLYLSGPDQDRYRFYDDTPSSLDNYPPTNYFPPISPEHDQDIIPELQQRFLPICFLPHLRVLFKLTDKIILLSVILSDPFTKSEFNYRSIYRNGSSQPGCFIDDAWKSLWRLPNYSPQWKKNVLNLSSSIRKKITRDGQILDEPQEYVLKLSRKAYFSHSYGKEKLDLTEIWQEDIGNLRSRAAILRSRSPILREFADKNIPPEDNYFEDVFLSPSNAKHKFLGKKVWGIVSKLSEKNCFYTRKSEDVWEPCFDGMPDEQDATFGCQLLNYLIWVRAIFDDDICAIETFNSINLSSNRPSQFVAFTSSPLNQADRARLKLTISTLLQPIENAYAIYAEAQAERKAVLHAAFRNSGHTLLARIGSVHKYFDPPYVPQWHTKLLDSIRAMDSSGDAYQEFNDDRRAYHCAWTEAKSLFELCLVLQLWGFSRPEDFWFGWEDPQKKRRFFDYKQTPFDLKLEIKEWCAEVFRFGPLGFDKDDSTDNAKYHDIYLRFDHHGLKKSLLHAKIKDLKENTFCRLGDGVLKAIFLEILNNAVRYGFPIQPDNQANWAVIDVFARVDTIYSEKRLVLWNFTGKEGQDTIGWQAIPPNAGKGLGLAAGVLRNLQLGDILERRFRTATGKQAYAVAIDLQGLELEGNN